LPEHSELSIQKQLLHIIPTIICYAISFVFIGSIWYRHLQVFGLLKTFNKTVVLLNLTMLFFIGLFPFSISLVTKNGNHVMIAIFIYLFIIACCKASQIAIEHYILIKKPSLRMDKDARKQIQIYKENKIAFIGLIALSITVILTFILIPNQDKKPIAWVWFSIFPLLLKYLKKKSDTKTKKSDFKSQTSN
jgi:uncharacterized membrane protein